MRLIIQAHINDANSSGAHDDVTVLAALERQDRSLSQVGLTRADGRAFLSQAQRALIDQQVSSWLAGHGAVAAADRRYATRTIDPS